MILKKKSGLPDPMASFFLTRTSFLEVELVRGLVGRRGGRQCWDLWLALAGCWRDNLADDVAARQRPATGDVVAWLSG
jgi:hypothetical protein